MSYCPPNRVKTVPPDQRFFWGSFIQRWRNELGLPDVIVEAVRREGTNFWCLSRWPFWSTMPITRLLLRRSLPAMSLFRHVWFISVCVVCF